MKRRTAGLYVMLCVAATSGVCGSHARAQSQTYLDPIATEFNWSAYAVAPPGDSERLFVVESYYGNVFAVDLTTGARSFTPFLHIDELPTPLNAEQGLLGLAFDPNFANNGYFYVNYTGSFSTTYVRRYQVLGNPMTSNVVDLASARTILTVSNPQADHNAGWMAFGPNDGYLYIATGDGGGVNDNGPGHTHLTGNAQDTTDNLLGKVLRIDVHGDDFPNEPDRNYAIPATNPFVGALGDDEIWAYGLRNPWRASFDRDTGDLWIGDVGQGLWEEINFQPASSQGGANYGWRLREGPIPTPGNGIGGNPPPDYVAPIYDYAHYIGDRDYIGTSVIGGYVYRGPVAAYYGHYFFADFVSGNLWKLDPDARDVRASVINVNDRLLANGDEVGLVSSFGEDAAGNLYITQLFGPGTVYRVSTHSKDAIWRGDDPTSGDAGDAVLWNNPENWERGGVADQLFAAEDNLILEAGSSSQFVSLGGNRNVAAVTFRSSFQLVEGSLKVLSGNVSVAAGVTATMDADLTAESSQQSLRKIGPGRLVINGQAGQMVVKEGTIGGVGILDHLTVRSGGVVAPGESPGVLTVNGSFKMQPGARLEIELGGNDFQHPRFGQYDQLVVGENAAIDGILAISLVDLGNGVFQPSAGDYFEILDVGGVLSGTFDAIELPDIPPYLHWSLDYFEHFLYLSFTPALAGDYNADGIVNSADYTVWRNSLGQSGWNLPADGSGPGGVPDGIVNRSDFDHWIDNFGRTLENNASAASVPEPNALLLALFVIVTLPIFRGNSSDRHPPDPRELRPGSPVNTD